MMPIRGDGIGRRFQAPGRRAIRLGHLVCLEVQLKSGGLIAGIFGKTSRGILVHATGGFGISSGSILFHEKTEGWGVSVVNAVYPYRTLILAVLVVMTAAAAFSAETAPAGATLRRGDAILLNSYRSSLARLESNRSGIPLYVESYERDDRVQVDVYGIFQHPYSSIEQVLKVPANWCEIVVLHPNVKGCSYADSGGACRMNFYLGRKTYQPPEKAVPVVTTFRNVEHQRHLEIMLTAEQGPYATRHHRMRFEALPLEGGRTFVHVSYTYRDSAALRLAAKIYFATIGRGLVGFTVTGRAGNGEPVYIGGPRGALERSAVRFYFAIQAFINSLRYPEAQRFSMRAGEWFDLTSRYRRQLLDLDRKKYLALKTREHANQAKLQRQTGTAAP